jgi:hypothetical protein
MTVPLGDRGARIAACLFARIDRAGAPFSNSRPEEEMDSMPLEVWSAFVAVAAGGFLILLGYIINRWRK